MKKKEPKKIKCPACDGKGNIAGKLCSKCKGTGFVYLLLD